ncbi:MAG TPA: hypothetical protein VMW23_02920 [Sedimentisphaerales bacterium]|nr:hypothetical protein [Sedimentisphaerales bacterium]
MKKKIILIVTVTLSAWLLCQAAQGMQFDANSIAEITTDPNHRVMGYEQTFAVSGDWAVWLDDRDPNWIPRIYGVNLGDVNHVEFLVDVNAPGCYQVAMSGSIVVYAVQDLSGPQYLAVADIADQNNPVIFDIALQIPYAGLFDISGSMIAYSGSDPGNNYQDTVYAADITDPCSVAQYTISVLPEYHSVRGLTIDGEYISWSVENYDGNDYVQVADVANPSEPNVLTAHLPAGITFENIDACGQWLATRGRYDWQTRVFAVHNYHDVNNWDIREIWREGENGEYFVSGPRIDGPITVWVTSTRVPSMGQQSTLGSDPEYLLKAAYLTGNGGFSLSTLLQDTNDIGAADISGSQVVWSKTATVPDLFKGDIELECGDWGYKRGDINYDCKVDFMDFAILALDWLDCTTPGGAGCEFGVPE